MRKPVLWRCRRGYLGGRGYRCCDACRWKAWGGSFISLDRLAQEQKLLLEELLLVLHNQIHKCRSLCEL